MTIGLLTWGAEKTLYNSLVSYEMHRLGDDEEKIALIQEATDTQIAMCESMGWRTIPLPVNVGIARGYRMLVEAATEPTFLFLENDWELIEYPHIQLQYAHQFLSQGVDLVRLRHRHNPGHPLWTKQFQGNEYARPTHLLDSIHWTDPSKFAEIRKVTKEYYMAPNLIYTDVDITISALQMDWFITTSRNANWTNNPHMARTAFLRELILPRLGGGNLEADIQGWWEQQDFVVAQSDGLFTHNRLD